MKAEDLKKIRGAITEIKRILGTFIIGQPGFIDGLLIGLLSGGHILIEGLPGLAKTRAVNLLASIASLHFQRLQFTPDLLPADLIGTRIYNQGTSEFEVKQGPIFANFILADEINRAPAKVQSALLEAMQERQITIADETFPLPDPFIVFATQNPLEQEGTYPLPEAQLDRFLLKLYVGYPSREDEERIVRLALAEANKPQVQSILDAERIGRLQRAVRNVFIEDRLISYITEIVQATRKPKEYGLSFNQAIEYGASPRGSIAIATASRARALMIGRDNVIPEDIISIAPAALNHRIILSFHAEADGITRERVIEEILEKIPAP